MSANGAQSGGEVRSALMALRVHFKVGLKHLKPAAHRSVGTISLDGVSSHKL
jgi:hypothetical protein